MITTIQNLTDRSLGHIRLRGASAILWIKEQEHFKHEVLPALAGVENGS